MRRRLRRILPKKPVGTVSRIRSWFESIHAPIAVMHGSIAILLGIVSLTAALLSKDVRLVPSGLDEHHLPTASAPPGNPDRPTIDTHPTP